MPNCLAQEESRIRRKKNQKKENRRQKEEVEENTTFCLPAYQCPTDVHPSVSPHASLSLSLSHYHSVLLPTPPDELLAYLSFWCLPTISVITQWPLVGPQFKSTSRGLRDLCFQLMFFFLFLFFYLSAVEKDL